MNIILLGPQGSGKGTQAEYIVKKYGLLHFSMGEYLREQVKLKTSLGKKIASIIDKGKYLPDELTNKLFLELLNKGIAKKGIILDGYPRSKIQSDFVFKNMKIDAAINIDISEQETIKRLSTRRICSKCGFNYSTITLKPKKEGICDKCGSKLIQRVDDTPEKIKKRLTEHKKKTSPLIEQYRSKGILHNINGEQSPEFVWKIVDSILSKLKK